MFITSSLAYYIYLAMPIETEKRLIDANLNRLREGIRVVEDIARYILDDFALASKLKNLRHRVRIGDSSFCDELLQNRDINNDILKDSTPSERNRKYLSDIITANFKRSEESARVLEEIFKLDSIKPKIAESALESSSDFNENKIDENKVICDIFKTIRYELYDVEIAFLQAIKQRKIL